MKVVNVCSDDWANFAHQFSESLKSVGVDSYSYCLNPHVFEYPKQSQVVPRDNLMDLTSDADFVIVHHSCVELLPYIHTKNLIHYAAGTKYRQAYDTLNYLFNKVAKATFIALPDFWDRGAVNPHYVVGAVDTKKIVPFDYYKGEIIFSHYPSNPEVKGSQTIIQAMKDIPVKFKYSLEKKPHNEQLKLMSDSDVYIELLAPTQGGRLYGSFGMTCLEAAALGKIVVTQNLHGAELYEETYGEFTPLAVRDEAHLKRMITAIIANQNDLDIAKEESREWVVNNHSYEATGKRALSILNDL